MKITMMLADHAQVADSKLYIMGGGWTVAGSGVPSAIAIIISVPWDEANVRHTAHLKLVDSDGGAFTVPTPNGEQPFSVSMGFEAGRPPGTKKGSDLPVLLAVNFPPLPLNPSTRYEWQLLIDDEKQPSGVLPFSTREMPPGQPTPPAP